MSDNAAKVLSENKVALELPIYILKGEALDGLLLCQRPHVRTYPPQSFSLFFFKHSACSHFQGNPVHYSPFLYAF